MNLGLTARSMSWTSWAVLAPVLGLLLIAYAGLPEGFFGRQFFARGGLMAVAVTMCFCFDDPASSTIDPSPTSLITRRGRRAVLAVGPWAVSVTIVVWGAINVRSTMPGSPTTTGAFARLVLEAATMTTAGLAVAAYASKRWDEQPGRIAAPALVALYALSWALPYPFRPWSAPNLPGWDTSLVWWWIALAVGVAGTTLFSWDARRYNWKALLRHLSGGKARQGGSQSAESRSPA